ncbi:M56 family metallopeptidase [Oculatella sp. LEGE 06141]|uniref:M56 family metallopeptidase n=1 Tax=Oculatella sp. LEGE 06141 TaxID=1828648 RepID=UPI0018813465|nr:M56 family metallopeptidase [Oculatella sp. LEGE 06141]MBE9179205.1 M56 family metallopeptidase [Oculatella sp. LEGE 06141]
MHFSLIVFSLGLAWSLRFWQRSPGNWGDRWQRTLGLFLLPPLLVLMTAIAVLCMGTQGTMLGLPVGWIGYSIALGFLGVAAGLGLYLAWQGWRSLQRIQTYPLAHLNNQRGRTLNTTALFAGQVGFWQPQLVVSRGLLQTLSPDQLHAVLTHEQAHVYYRDTFWFFWLGWLRQFTAWLPHTEVLWQELLLLRELRADRWAAQRVDSLLLAESLLLVVRSPLLDEPIYSAAFGSMAATSRLEERIDALLTASPASSTTTPALWLWLFVSLLPLLTICLHA